MLFFRCAVVLSIAAAAFSVPAIAAEPATSPLVIFADHAAAVGYSLSAGSAKAYIMTLKTTWTDRNGVHTQLTVAKRAGVYSYDASTSDGIGRSSGFDGHGFWRADADGNIAPEIGYRRPFAVTWSVIDSEAFDSTVSPEMRNPVGDSDVVRIHPPSGVPADVFFNRKTHLIDKVIVDPGRENSEETYSDYQRKAGIAVAMSRKSGDANTTVTKFQWDAPLRADEFNRPQQRNYATFPASGFTTLNFDPDKYSGVVVEATINGIKGRFLIDSGASNVVVNPGLARRAGLNTFGSLTVERVCNTESAKFARPDSFKIGDVELKNFTVLVPDKDLGSSNFDGLIGYSVLNQTVFSIDFDKKQITFSNPTNFQTPVSTGYLVIGMDGGTPQIQSTVNAKVPVFMDLDLGASGISLIFTQRFLDANPGILQGGFSYLRAAVGTLAQFDIGPFQFYGLSAGALICGGGFTQNKLLQGLVGYETLRRFNLTFDYRSNKMYMTLNNYGNETKFGGGRH